MAKKSTLKPELPTNLSPAQLKLYASAFNRLVASKGGKARARALTPTERRKIAQKAARARWGTAGGANKG